MKFLLLCQIQPAAFAQATEAEMQQMEQAMLAYNQQLIAAGVLADAGQLAMPHEATRVTQAAGHLTETRGPALAGDTQIGGYYVVDVPGEKEAVAWAAQCPLAHVGALEVRQIVYSPV
jgi:hypothetical protein